MISEPKTSPPSAGCGVVERLDADPIAREEEAPGAGVPDREREHAAEALDARVSPLLVAVHDDFRVGVRPEPVPAALELGAQRRKVVDLAVEDDPHRVVFVRQRLLAGGDVDDAQPAVGEADAFAEIEAVGVRAAMGDRSRPSRESDPRSTGA